MPIILILSGRGRIHFVGIQVIEKQVILCFIFRIIVIFFQYDMLIIV